MTTSTAQIAALIASNTELKAFFEGERSLLKTARENLPALLEVLLYVDEVNGLAGGDGTLAAPFATVDAAINSLKPGQTANIRALSDITMRKSRMVTSINVQIQGFASDASAPQQRSLAFLGEATNRAGYAPGFDVRVGGFFAFMNLNITMPASGVSYGPFRAIGTTLINLFNCSISGAGGTVALVRGDGPFAIGLASGSTYTGMGGRWVSGFASGVPLSADVCGGLIDPAITN